MKKIVIGIFILLFFTGCDVVGDMKGMFEKQEIAQSKIKEKYGWESQLGFNMHNGVLTQVTITLDAKDVRNESVAKLEKIVKDVVVSTFKSTPGVIYIQIKSLSDEKL